MNNRRIADWVLRVGVAFAFLYPPLNAFMDPNAWVGYFPSFLRGFLPDPTILHVFGSIEIIIALWILSGWRIFWPSLVATGMLLGIVAFNLPNFQVLFRDLSIAAMAFGLAMLHLENEGRGRASGEITA